MTGATIVAIAITAKAPARCAGLKVSRMIACWVGWSPPPKNPCRQRNTTSGRGRLIARRDKVARIDPDHEITSLHTGGVVDFERDDVARDLGAIVTVLPSVKASSAVS
jgi:hypothetical protein